MQASLLTEPRAPCTHQHTHHTTLQHTTTPSAFALTLDPKVGNNTLGVWLGNGWWNPLPLLMWGRLNLRSYITTGEPTFIVRLLVEYADGTSDNVVSDLSWLTHPSPILKNNICTSFARCTTPLYVLRRNYCVLSRLFALCFPFKT